MLWDYTLVATYITKILGIKRERNSRKNKNKMCLNMFFDEKGHGVKSDKNLYTAHENSTDENPL